MREYRGFYYKEGRKGRFWRKSTSNKFGTVSVYADNFAEAQEKVMLVSTNIADVIILLPISKQRGGTEE